MLLVIGGPTHPDPVAKRPNGYAGVIALPGPAVPAPATSGRVDPPADSKRDTRVDRGRVIYSTGHAPRDSMPVRALHRHPCPDQRVSQVGRGSNAPTS